MSTIAAIRLAYTKHLDQFWNRHEKKFIDVNGASIKAKVPKFRVIELSPDEVNPIEPWAYVSYGAHEVSKRVMTEFMLLSPVKDDRHLQTVAAVVRTHGMLPNGLTPGSTVALAHGWREGSTLMHLLVTLPYPYGPMVETCTTPSGELKLYWLMPITAAEAKYVGEHGLEAMEQKFESVGVDFTQVNRASVV